MKKILYLNGNLLPTNSGDSIYSSSVIKRLTQFKISLITFGSNELWLKSELSNLNNITPYFVNRDSSFFNKLFKVLFLGSIKQVYSKSYIDTLVKLAVSENFDYIIIDHLRVYSLYSRIKFVLNSNSKLIYIAHNLEYVNLIEKINFDIGFFNRIKSLLFDWKLKKLELDALNFSDIIWTLTNEDLLLLKDKVKNKSKFKKLEPYCDYSLVKSHLEISSKKLLILGGMDWYPNIEGTLHFVADVFSKLLMVDKEFKLYIVGRNPVEKIRKLQSSNIFVTGTVDNIDNYVQECDLLVLPNRLGTGIKVKVMEIIMKGLPVIMYSENKNGYDSELFIKPFVVNNSEEFITSIVYLTKNPSVRIDFVKRTREYFLENFNFDFKLK